MDRDGCQTVYIYIFALPKRVKRPHHLLVLTWSKLKAISLEPGFNSTHICHVKYFDIYRV